VLRDRRRTGREHLALRLRAPLPADPAPALEPVRSAHDHAVTVGQFEARALHLRVLR